jgi:recombination protein RecR
MKYPLHLIKLIETLKKLPGVGTKSAERFAFHMLDWQPQQLREMSTIIADMPSQLCCCPTCGCLEDNGSCPFCIPERLQHQKLCIIACAKEAFAIEATGEFHGCFHVLGTLLSPMSGKGADMIDMDKLFRRIKSNNVTEVVIALDSTLEGDATALYLKSALTHAGVTISRLAFGIPMGSSLEYVDGGTLAKAFSGRSPY